MYVLNGVAFCRCFGAYSVALVQLHVSVYVYAVLWSMFALCTLYRLVKHCVGLFVWLRVLTI